MPEVTQTADNYAEISAPQTVHTGSGLGGKAQMLIDKSGMARPHGWKKPTTGGARRQSTNDQTSRVQAVLKKASPGECGEALGTDCYESAM